MTRIVLMLLIGYVTLYGGYKDALSYYKKGLYKQALQEAKRSKKSYSNPNLHLIWGYSAQQLGRTEEAMNAFERVLIFDSDNKQAKTSLRKIYIQTGRRELLQKKDRDLRYALRERGMPQKLVRRPSLPLKAKASIALGYNDNVNATPGSAVLDTYFETEGSEQRLSSFFSKVTTDIDYNYDFGEEKGWYMKTALNAFIQSNFSAHLYDLSTVSLEQGIGYETKNYNLYVPLSYSRVNYLDKDLLDHLRFLPTLFISVDDNTMLNVSLLYSENNYIQSEDKIKDDKSWGFSTGGYFLFGQHFAYISAKYENKSAVYDEAPKYVGAEYITATFGVHYYLSTSLLATLDYRFRYGRYKDRVGFSNTIRDDNLHLLDLKLSYSFSKNGEVYISESYTQNLSNFVPSEYKRNSVLIGMSYKY